MRKRSKLKSSLMLIIGGMYVGKSGEMAAICELYAKGEHKSIIVRYKGDTRYTSEEELVTHNKCRYRALPAEKLADVMDELLRHDVIGIDEGSFFDDLVPVVKTLLEEKKVVIVSILDGAYDGSLFSKPYFAAMDQYQKLCETADELTSLRFLRDNLEALTKNWTALIPFSDVLVKKHGLCTFCGVMGAGMTLKTTRSDKIVEVGADDKYVSACRQCWTEHSKSSGIYLSTSQ